MHAAAYDIGKPEQNGYAENKDQNRARGGFSRTQDWMTFFFFNSVTIMCTEVPDCTIYSTLNVCDLLNTELLPWPEPSLRNVRKGWFRVWGVYKPRQETVGERGAQAVCYGDSVGSGFMVFALGCALGGRPSVTQSWTVGNARAPVSRPYLALQGELR